MNESQPENGPEVISRFRAVVVAALRVKQLRRGSKPRIELDDKKHKDTIIAMEEVRRGLINFTQFALPQVPGAEGLADLSPSLHELPPVVVSTGSY